MINQLANVGSTHPAGLGGPLRLGGQPGDDGNKVDPTRLGWDMSP